MKQLFFAMTALAILTGCSNKMENENQPQTPVQPESIPPQQNILYDQRSTLFELLPVGPEDIVMFGNSLTHHCEWNELFGIDNIKNRGIQGDIIEGLYQRAEPIVKGQPKKIFILSGVNDISHNVTPDSIGRVMDKLIKYIKTNSPSTKIYLQSLLPINNSFERYKAIFGKEEDVRQSNVVLEQVAKDNDVVWINLYPHFADEEGNLRKELTNDGLHILGPGYMIWKEQIQDYIME